MGQKGCPPGTLFENRLPIRILDVLETDGESTAVGIAARLGANEAAVKRALYRLRDAGRVVSRPDVGDFQAAPVHFRGQYSRREAHRFTSHEVEAYRAGYRNLWKVA